MRPKSKCKDCKKREVGCHANCPDYIQFRKEVDELNEKRREAYENEFWKVEKLPIKKESRYQTKRLIQDYS